jgi:hypothetical protein
VTYAHDAQHTALSQVASQPLSHIHWSTPVDLDPQYVNNELLIHYASPLVTAGNTVIVAVKTGATDGFRVEGRRGDNGALLWTQPTDYVLPGHDWTPSFPMTLTPQNRLYFAGAGGTLYYLDNPDSPTPTTGHIAFYGIANYTHDFDGTVFINTPITPDSVGNIYFGFLAADAAPLNLMGGIARMPGSDGGSWIAASTAANDGSMSEVAYNSAPALSMDESKLYVLVSDGGSGYLTALNSATLAPLARVHLVDPLDPDAPSHLFDDGSASPTVGPDGDVYMGVLENPFNSSKGWLLHFHGDLTPVGAPGAFGWDDTASIVPSTMVPSYTGTSTYLLMTKYNNYKDLGGDGINKIAILDPNDSQIDDRTGATVMKEVMTHAGVTPDPEFPAVREWCINTAAVDPFTKSILANSEDGWLYRWDVTTNTFSESINLTDATGEAYTPTVIGPDGTVYAINNARLFAVGS